MKVIISIAGSNTRLRSHTFISPKTLLYVVAGHPILNYLLELLLEIPNFSKRIFVVGDNGAQSREYVDRHYDLPLFIGASGIVEMDGEFITCFINKPC